MPMLFSSSKSAFAFAFGLAATAFGVCLWTLLLVLIF
jgi:hypothetical protein